MTWLNWPNRISIARILLIAPLVICLLNHNVGWGGWRYLAIGIFGLMAISDALDGYLARRLGEETPLGKFLDPLADKLLVTCAVILLAIGSTAVPGYRLPSWVAVLAIGKDLLTVIGFGLVYATTGEFFIRPRILGKACTVVQLVMIAFCLVAPDVARFLLHSQLTLALLYWLASGLAVMALADYVRIGNRFAAEQHSQTEEARTR